MQAVRSQLEAAGLLDVDHEQYLKPVTGDGIFLDAKSGTTTKLASQDIIKSNHNNTTAEDSLLEVHRQFDSIPLTSDCMDEDIAAALFGDFDAEEFEELDDAFVLQASEETDGGTAAAFDFDSHIQELIEKAKRARSDDHQTEDHEYGQADQAFFGGLHPLNEDEEYDNEASSNYMQNLNADEEKALCDLFHETLAEYEDDGSEDLPEQEITGHMHIEGNAMLEAAMDDFLQEDPQEILMRKEDISNRSKGGFSVLVGKQMVPAKDLEQVEEHPEQEPARPLDELLEEARDTLARPKQQPPAEEIFIDGKSYFSERERSQWDCESILSTYSNLDNNPHTVDVTEGRRRRRKSAQPDQTIRLSNKTGLPIEKMMDDTASGMDDLTATVASVNRGVPRPKAETAEERKLRKQMVKKERELARIQKKMTKEAFDDEFRRRAAPMLDDIAGKTVFRFA